MLLPRPHHHHTSNNRMGCGASTTATAVKTEPGCDFAEFQACYQKQIGRDLTVAEEKSLRQR